MDRALLIVALVCYLAPALARKDGFMRVLATRWWVPAGLLLHVQALVLTFFLDDVPLRSMTEGLGLTALLVMVARLWLSRNPRMAAIQRILLGLAGLLMVLAALAPSTRGTESSPPVFFLLHIGLVLTGFAGFALTFSMSTLYLGVRRRLKRKRLSDIGSLPSLDTLDALIMRTMAFGFATLTAGIAVGFAWSYDRQGSVWPGDFTTIITMAVWLWYALGLAARVAAGLRGRVAAIFGVVGFAAFLLITAVGLLLSGFHGAAG